MADGQVVIIGAGVAGIMTAKRLVKQKAKVVLIHSTSYFEWPLAGVHTVTHCEDFGKAVSAGSQHHVAGAENIVGIAQGVTDSEVLLDGDRKIPYKAIVVCVGMNMGIITPKVGESWEERKNTVEKCGQAMKKAEIIVIGGAGLVALETAGAAREVNSTARIIMASRWKGPLEDGTFSPKYTEKLKKQLELNRLEISADFEVTDKEPCFEKREIKLGSDTVSADVYLPAFNQGFRASFLGDAANARGQVKVNEFLQSVVNPNMFAVGCSDKCSISAIMKIDSESSAAAANIKLLLQGKPMKSYQDKSPLPPTMKLGHSYAWIEYEKLPAGGCLKCCGFPCCICLCCCGHPFACGMCCGDPEGKATARFMKSMILHSTGMTGIKGLNTPPTQQKM
eukprot:TRINITY_DN57770_c0_g1_i1.p1 TRINITY_DN57770_c0_g1~~TRINITY_DN57770_c0_g1_i1.p1  ORF type:complete len:394 (+),score=82.30 TRINITY_DN57770_c0_g1_i1:64-1245(+)